MEEESVSSNQSSVEISRTSKGLISYRVKVYDRDIDQARQKAIVENEKMEQYAKKKNNG